MSTFSKEFSSEKHIVIPSIQREYVQPLNESIICGFVDALINAYYNDEHKDLNYIYGVEKDSYFEPIDGQQRLTTLWLLHLYVASRIGKDMPAKLEYRTRELSSDFCVKLRENAGTILSWSSQPSKDIKNASWFIESWEENVTVYSMLHALDVIHRQIESSNIDINRIWQNMIKDDSPVTFAFTSTKDLGDDIYVKMNARGKALSDFENLKSWLDDRIKSINTLDDAFLKDWREKIDNEWTDLFWRNRNLNDLFPEEIDEEQLRLFYTVAYIIWAEKSKGERARIIRNEADRTLIASLLKVNGEDVEVAILKRMRKSTVDLPLYLLDKLNIFNESFFITITKILNGLIRYEDEINNNLQAKEEDFTNKIYFWDLPEEKKPITFLCQLLMSEKGQDVPYTKMAIAAALCYYVQNSEDKTSLLDWMRFIRNVANNIDIHAESIKSVLSTFKEWAKLCATKDIKELIAQIQVERSMSKQLEEEKKKILLYDDQATYRTICWLENHKFFFGRIGFLLDIADQAESKSNTLLTNYAKILYNFFGADGPHFDSEADDDYLAHRVLLACSQKFKFSFGHNHKRSLCLIESRGEWKDYLDDFKIYENGSMPRNIGFTLFLKEIGTADNLCKDSIKAILNKYKKIISDEDSSDWRIPLLEHPGLWKYMGNNCLKFENNYNVLLIPGVILQSFGRRSELRARALYLDLKHGDILHSVCSPTENEVYKPCSWSLNFWEYGGERKDKNSCIYFQKEKYNETLAIDIYFDVEFAQNNLTENAYCLELFVRENERDNETLIPINESIWSGVVNSIEHFVPTREKNQGRYVYIHLSRQDIITILINNIL